MIRLPRFFLGLLVPLLGGEPSAQSNTIPGADVRLADAFTFQSNGRLGTYPSGQSGFSAGVTVCNTGTVTLPWQAPMSARHPVYAFVLMRESEGRFEQISDRSYVKHGFASINANFCGTCRTFNGQELGPNCSDTYGAGLNADRFYLGPPSEIDPWLGDWDPIGSHFDRGQPDVGPPANRDGRRSLTRTQTGLMDPVEHRIRVEDKDLTVPGANFYYQIYIVVAGEAESLREDNMIVRQIRPTWSGSTWNWSDVGGQSNGSVLRMWSGAKLSSAANGSDDGRIYVGVRVTGPDARGLWHYEYALHNRDNAGGIAAFRLPICPNADVWNASFRGLDSNPANAWQVSVQGGEIAFVAPPSNPLEWNTIYNFSFDSNAAPIPGNAIFDQARVTTAAAQFPVGTDVPGLVFSPITGAGCGAPAPRLSPTGTPPIPTVPNPFFGLLVENMAPNASGALLFSFGGGSTPVGNCSIWLDLTTSNTWGSITANGAGVAVAPQSIPIDPSLEGGSVWWQAIELKSGGELLGVAELSNGLRTRIGNQTSGCN